MKKTCTILMLMAFGLASATAGVAPAPAHSGKSVPPPPSADPCAGPISYNSLEVLYANTSGDYSEDDADGFRVNFEYSPAANFYVRATGSYDEADYWDTWGLSLGVGGYIALNENIHAAVDGGVLYEDFSLDARGNLRGFDDDDTGWYVRPHLRAKWSCFEIHAGATYSDIWDDTDWAWFAQVYYQVAQGWDISAGYSEHDDSDGDVWTIGVRRRF